MPHTNNSITAPDTGQPVFPESAWRGLFVDYQDMVADTTEASDDLIWAAFAGVLSALASLCVTLRLGTGVMRPTLFFLLMGETSRTRKTTAITDAVDIVLEPLRPRATQAGEPDPFIIVRGQGSGEGMLEALADKAWWPDGAKSTGQPPNLQTGRSALYMFDEFGAFLDKAKRDQAGNFTGFHLNLYDAPTQMMVSTRSNKLVATNAYGTILAASTTDYLARGVSEDLVMSGFVNRFLFFTGLRTAPIPLRPPVDEPARKALVEKVRANMEALRGQEMTVSPEARQVNATRYSVFYNREVEPLLDAATARNHTNAVRLAMVFAFADGSSVITGDHMSAAWDMTDYSGCVVAKLLAKMKSKDFEAAEKKLLRAARKLSSEQGGTFTRGDLRSRLRGGNGMSAKAFSAVWEAVVSAQDIIMVASTSQQAEPRYYLNPSIVAE